MGYLNNNIITVDAILTKKGREVLAQNNTNSPITQFALSDDEIDYKLYNPTHPLGIEFYGQAIDNLPILEAFPDEQQIMKNKLVTLPRGTAKLPVIDIGFASIVLKQGNKLNITPQTLNYLGNNQTSESSGYSATIGDIRVLSSITGLGIDGETLNENPSNSTIGTNISKTVKGSQINITATTVNSLFGNQEQLKTTLTIEGLDSGARITLPVTITKQIQ